MSGSPIDFKTAAREVSWAVLDYLVRYVGNAGIAEDLLPETPIRMKGLPASRAAP